MKKTDFAYQLTLNDLKTKCEKFLKEMPEMVDEFYYNRFTKTRLSDVKDYDERILAMMVLTSNRFSWNEDLNKETRIAYTHICNNLTAELYDKSKDVRTIHQLLD